MKCTAWVRIDTDVEVDVSVKEFLDELASLPKPERIAQLTSGLNTCLSFVRDAPDALVAELTPAQRSIITSVLLAQAERYKGVVTP